MIAGPVPEEEEKGRMKLDLKSLPSPSKAKKMLKDGEANGRPLTESQKKLFRMIASGKIPTKVSEIPKHVREGLR